jgi:DNA-binding NtrC family response regulator
VPACAAPDDALHWPLASVLVVDDERGMRSFLERALSARVAQVCTAADADEAQALVQTHHFDLVILDVALPGKNGIDWLRELRAQQYSAEVILITAYADLDTAIEALRAGANDFILKPFRVTQVLNAVKQRLEKAHLARENWVLRRDLSRHVPSSDGLIGSSIVVQGLKAALRRVASVASTVLLTGESGTGKELAALALHRQSARAAGPFVPINCATMLPDLIESELFGQAPRRSGDSVADRRDGLFVYAQGGTLFLDGIAELPLPQQATLLRVLEERKVRPVGSQQEIAVDVRIVAASNRPLADEVAQGRFRQDLYYRLQVVELRLAPLRAHKEDIAELVQHFIATLAPQLGVAPIAVSEHELDFLRQYDWPGNVRELRNLIERSLILGSLNVSALYPGGQREVGAGAAHAAGASGAARVAPTDLLTLERQHIQGVLASVDGDKTEAARLLGISRRTLERRVADWAQEG